MDWCNKAIEGAPNSADFRDSRALMHALLGENKAAINDLEYALPFIKKYGSLTEKNIALRQELLQALKSNNHEKTNQQVKAILEMKKPYKAPNSNVFAYSKNHLDKLGKDKYIIDVFGQPAPNSDGIYGWTELNYPSGKTKEIIYRDENWQPTHTNADNLIAIKKYEYDESGNETSQAYFDKEGLPTADSNGVFSYLAEYENNFQISSKTFDAKGDLMEDEHGIAITKYFPYKENKTKKFEYYDSNGNIIENDRSQWVRTYNKEDLEIEGRGFDKFNNLHNSSSTGRAIVRKEYDENGKIILEKSYGQNNQKINRKDHGWYMKKWIRSYSGKVLETKCFDTVLEEVEC